MDERTAVTALAALAQEARLRVFRALVGAAPDGMTPGALAAMLDVPASTLSFHLKELVHAGLVAAERDGRNLHYRPALGRMNDLLAYLTAHCCMGQPCTPAAAATTAATTEPVTCCTPDPTATATTAGPARRPARSTTPRTPR